MTNLEMVRKLFPAFNWIATDKNDLTWLYIDKPEIKEHKWVVAERNRSHYLGACAQQWMGIDLHLADNWKESLTELHPIETITMPTRWIANLKWMATDSRGDTRIYEHKPELINGDWQASSIAGLVMSINYQYHFDSHESSLRQLKWE